jgi:hypothetical protein
MEEKVIYKSESLDSELDKLKDLQSEKKVNRFNANPENVEQGLAKLVLTLIKLIKCLLEKQAVRRMEADKLTDEEIERMGETFMKLDQRLDLLKQEFGLEDEDLNLNLGPLGDLM